MEKALLDLGLTQVESKVYITLLDLGPSLAGQISRKSGIHRRMVYDATERLIQKGLIGYIIQNNRRLFSAVDPARLQELIKEKENELGKILPELKGKYNFTKEKQETLFFKGKAGVKTAFEDQIAEGKEILIFGASPLAQEILKFYFIWFDKRRAEKKIPVKIIFDESARGKTGKIPLAQVRYLDFASPTATNVYGDKVMIVLWSKDSPISILIKQKEIADSYRQFFELMWKTAKK